MQWIDVGVNLTHESFNADRDAVLARARAVGVTQLIVTGTDLASSTQAAELALRGPQVLYATAGVHPHHASQMQAEHLPELRTLLARPEVVAAGECGLDYHRNYSPRQAQIQAFEWQLALAVECRKPLFLHQRDAHGDFVAMLRNQRPVAGGVAHCFTGSAAEMEQYLELGLSIGITGWFNDERRGAHLAAIVARIPAQRLLLETDAPYLLPRDLEPRPKTRRNEPMYLPHIGGAVARARGESSAECARHTSTHARELFGLTPTAG